MMDRWMDTSNVYKAVEPDDRNRISKKDSNGAALNVEKFSDFISIELPAFTRMLWNAARDFLLNHRWYIHQQQSDFSHLAT